MSEHEGPFRAGTTRLLLEVRSFDGGDAAREELFTAVYDELRRMARDLMRSERANHTLTPTALVHEVYVRLIDGERVTWENRAHFFGIAARAMRQILVGHARRRGAAKRGGGATHVTLGEPGGGSEGRVVEMLDLDHALERLEALDRRTAQVVELRTFGGLTSTEVAHLLGVSKRTVDGEWSFGRMWLNRELSSGGAG